MSETEHIKGKLIPTDKTVADFVGDVTLKKWHSDINDYFRDEYDDKAIEIDGKVYVVESEHIEPWDDIFRSKKNVDGTIDFEVKYYNGGCGFDEAIREALEKGLS